MSAPNLLSAFLPNTVPGLTVIRFWLLEDQSIGHDRLPILGWLAHQYAEEEGFAIPVTFEPLDDAANGVWCIETPDGYYFPFRNDAKTLEEAQELARLLIRSDMEARAFRQAREAKGSASVGLISPAGI